ncbi:MAG: HAD-IB family hydrolase [Bacteroidia bacterium]
MKKDIAFFDFDGTITNKDTLLEFIKFTKGWFQFYSGLALNLTYLIAYRLRIISNQTAKEKILKFFFYNTPVQKFEEYCKRFSHRLLPSLLRPEALTEIRRLKEENVLVVIVSASPENWIKNWANENELGLIASRLEVSNGLITGKIVGKNCAGDEKVSRIKQAFDLSRFNIIAAYGDTSGDKPMLRLANRSFYKHFR